MELSDFLSYISSKNGINDKAQLTSLAINEFGLTRDRSVYYSSKFAVRFSSAAKSSFSNTVLSLSNLKKYDHLPFLVCVVTPSENHIFLANSSLLKKISHSSHELRENNIRGSFNGSDISRDFNGIANSSENIERLFQIHEGIGFEENLTRLVESTNGISPTGKKFSIDAAAKKRILDSPSRANSFVNSSCAQKLKEELDEKVKKYTDEILIAALIENVNVRGRVIEYLIAGENEELRSELVSALSGNKDGLPQFKTENDLGDYQRIFPDYFTETDVKTKIMILHSNPKAYNLDKMLEFLSKEKSVFMFYFVGIDPLKIVNTVLVSLFQEDLLGSTIILKHWAGRNSRGVTQFEGKTIGELVTNPKSAINTKEAVGFLEKVMAL